MLFNLVWLVEQFLCDYISLFINLDLCKKNWEVGGGQGGGGG